MQITKQYSSGFTLVELMVVVAIIGVLAAMSSIGYTRYIRSAQMEELEQIAKEFAAGQERFRSRQNAYYPIAGGTKTWAGDAEQMKALLEVRSQLPSDIRLRIHSWEGTGTAGIPSCGFCRGMGDTSSSGFLIGVQRNFDDTVEADDPMVIITNSLLTARLDEGNK